MKPIRVRYGASVDITVNIDDTTAQSATLYVGVEGEPYTITKANTFTSGVADLSLDPEETEVPLGEYKYQINISYSDGRLKKFPEPTSCTNELPTFEVCEALDETEVIS